MKLNRTSCNPQSQLKSLKNIIWGVKRSRSVFPTRYLITPNLTISLIKPNRAFLWSIQHILCYILTEMLDCTWHTIIINYSESCDIEGWIIFCKQSFLLMYTYIYKIFYYMFILMATNRSQDLCHANIKLYYIHNI